MAKVTMNTMTIRTATARMICDCLNVPEGVGSAGKRGGLPVTPEGAWMPVGVGGWPGGDWGRSAPKAAGASVTCSPRPATGSPVAMPVYPG